MATETFEQLKTKLSMTETDCLMLDGVAMIVMPRWFYVGIMQRVKKLAGPEIAQKIFYEAGYDGAVKWAETQIREAGLAGRAVMMQYLNSIRLRGWGRFEIVDFEEQRGIALIRAFNSAVALETGSTRGAACVHLPGSLAGAFQAILNHAGIPKKVIGRESKCISKGDDYCEFAVEEV